MILCCNSFFVGRPLNVFPKGVTKLLLKKWTKMHGVIFISIFGSIVLVFCVLGYASGQIVGRSCTFTARFHLYSEEG